MAALHRLSLFWRPAATETVDPRDRGA